MARLRSIWSREEEKTDSDEKTASWIRSYVYRAWNRYCNDILSHNLNERKKVVHSADVKQNTFIDQFCDEDDSSCQFVLMFRWNYEMKVIKK